ncbi:MAG: glutamine-hydrolyzing carbamoyl-phosphate synthase small subunit [Phycisphaerae bacterium]
MPGAADTGRCMLALEDGTVFTGHGFGAPGTRCGEVVFHTAFTGYQEILTDPSYTGQIVAMTYPLIGNYGVNADDVESSRLHAAGLVVRELARVPTGDGDTMRLEALLADHGVVGIQGIDTRALTRKLRVHGAMRGVITTELDDPAACVRRAVATPSLVGADLVQAVAPDHCFDWSEGVDVAAGGPKHHAPRRGLVVVIDCGVKHNILRYLVTAGFRVHVVPPTARADAIRERKPTGVLVSNGPGDPAAVPYAIDLLKALLGRVPVFGICLGHQLLGLALGGTTYKLKFGHHGANHPVRNAATGRVEITSQNHGFAIDTGSLIAAGATPTHINLNDDTLEGFTHPDMPLFAVQYHPEAGPGPHDATYLFDCFATMIDTGRSPTAEDMAQARGQALVQA